MNEHEQDQHTQPKGRTFTAKAYGDTPEELEFTALEQAQEFFWEGEPLQIINDYNAIGASSANELAKGKKYFALVRVRAVNR